MFGISFKEKGKEIIKSNTKSAVQKNTYLLIFSFKKLLFYRAVQRLAIKVQKTEPFGILIVQERKG
jgi:hypothetical protein